MASASATKRPTLCSNRIRCRRAGRAHIRRFRASGPCTRPSPATNAQVALDAAIAYTKGRKQFGKSISSFQAIQFELADMAMKVEAARLLVYTAAARAQRGEAGLGFISAAAKCFASDVAMDVTESAVQLYGGAGYTRDFPIERMMRDAKIHPNI